jgi:Protein of unknown function (DUF2794)
METVTPIGSIHAAAPSGIPEPASVVLFSRPELMRILDVYGRMVSAGHWRDYAIDMTRDAAIFSAFRRASERPEFQIIKRPALARKQGAWALVSQTGGVLKRGFELETVLHLIERRLIKLVHG